MNSALICGLISRPRAEITQSYVSSLKSLKLFLGQLVDVKRFNGRAPVVVSQVFSCNLLVVSSEIVVVL